jgi:hypothetical protein
VTERLDRLAVGLLAAAAGLALPEEDRDLLVEAFAAQAKVVQSLLSVDVAEMEPIVTFDPRWR